MNDATSLAADSSRVVTIQTTIEASPADVWRGLVDEVGAWWPDEIYSGGEAGKRRYVLEAWPGGRAYEEWESGGGLLWGQVIMVTPESLLQTMGCTFPEWGGPAIEMNTWRLESTDDGCSLLFTTHIIGDMTDDQVAGREKGWSFLFDGVLKAHVEGRPLPRWEG